MVAVNSFQNPLYVKGTNDFSNYLSTHPYNAPKTIIPGNTNLPTSDTFETKTENNGCTDGKDDGKIGFKEKAGSFLKGLVSPVTSMFKSPKNFVKGALTIAAGTALWVATGGAAAPLLVAAGVVGGGIQVVKGAVNASKATTDAEAKAAWEGIGAGSGAIGMAVIGAKKAAVAGGIEGAENMNALQATAACIKSAPTQFGKSVGAFTSGEAVTNLKNAFGKSKTAVEEESKNKTPEEKAEKMKQDAKKQEVNAEKQRKQQLEHNEKAKAKHEAKVEQQKAEAQQASEQGAERVKNGESYEKVKNDVTKNKTHENKKIAKEGAETARNEKLAKETAAQKENPKTINEAADANKKLVNKAKYAETPESAQATVQEAQANADKAWDAANKTMECAAENPNNKTLQAQADRQLQKAQEAQKFLEQTQENAAARTEELQTKSETPAIEKTTPKTKNNVKITDQRVQGKMKTLKYKSDATLQDIAKNSTNKFERAAAEAILQERNPQVQTPTPTPEANIQKTAGTKANVIDAAA